MNSLSWCQLPFTQLLYSKRVCECLNTIPNCMFIPNQSAILFSPKWCGWLCRTWSNMHEKTLPKNEIRIRRWLSHLPFAWFSPKRQLAAPCLQLRSTPLRQSRTFPNRRGCPRVRMSLLCLHVRISVSVHTYTRLF